MKKSFIFLVVCLFTCLCWNDASAQDTVADSILRSNALSSVRLQYMKNLGAASYLFNGEAYERYWNASTGHPFYLGDHEFRQGSVYYAGTLYENVPLMYDIYRDQLVSKPFGKESDMKLLGEKVASFSIGSQHFVRVWADSNNTSSIPSGFYERPYNGNVVVLVKHLKKLERSLEVGDNVSRFKEYTHYYILKDGRYLEIDSEGDLQSAFRDQKAEVRKFLNRKDINFKKDKGRAIVQTAAYYEQLKK